MPPEGRFEIDIHSLHRLFVPDLVTILTPVPRPFDQGNALVLLSIFKGTPHA